MIFKGEENVSFQSVVAICFTHSWRHQVADFLNVFLQFCFSFVTFDPLMLGQLKLFFSNPGPRDIHRGVNHFAPVHGSRDFTFLYCFYIYTYIDLTFFKLQYCKIIEIHFK